MVHLVSKGVMVENCFVDVGFFLISVPVLCGGGFWGGRARGLESHIWGIGVGESLGRGAWRRWKCGGGDIDCLDFDDGSIAINNPWIAVGKEKPCRIR